MARDAVVQTGPLLPDLRFRDVGPVGVTLTLGKTEVGSIEELVERYAFIASDPTVPGRQGAGRRGRHGRLGRDPRARPSGLVPIAVFLLLGRHRRGELFRGAAHPAGTARPRPAAGAAGPGLAAVGGGARRRQEEQGSWQTLAELAGPDVVLPAEVRDIEVRTGPVTTQSKRLVLSAIDTYDKSKEFYSTAAEGAADLDRPRSPRRARPSRCWSATGTTTSGWTGSPVRSARRPARRVVLDAGDDTSTGQPWEAFSLDSLAGAFDDWDRFGVAGNHDHGTFVSSYLADEGWTMLDGEAVDAPWGGTLLGVDDPRSSGLGNWRDESGLSFTEVGDRLADAACAAAEDGERVSTVLVHDANLGREALARGCVDLVLGGHTHVQSGPTEVTGEDGASGWTWTNGTTGGAAYAIAIGSKPRRDADVSLVTYADGRPVGLQWVRLRTDGSWLVGDWEPITPAPVIASSGLVVRKRSM